MCLEKQTGLKGHEQVIGGGTFGRLLETWGCSLVLCSPDWSLMHQATSSQMSKISNKAAIYAEAIMN